MEIVDDKVLLIRTRRPEVITDRIKKSAVVNQIQDFYEIAVNWGYKEAQTLAELRIKNVPSTIKRDYEWGGKYKPFAHQKETASFLTLHKKAFCFNEQGTGKTVSVIWAADYLMRLGEVKRVLIVCPLSIMNSAWQQDLFKVAMHRSCAIAHGSSEQRKRVIKEGTEFVIINFDGLSVVRDELVAGRFDLIVVDEATAFKNHKTNRWKALNEVAGYASRLWLLTGTPAAQSPVDAYGLAKLVNPNGVPKFFNQFRDSVMMKVGMYRWVPKAKAKLIVHAALQPAIRFEKDQCLDLPEVTYVEREVPLTAQQKKYYRTLKQQMIIEAAGETITSLNAATNLNKLLQVSCGAIYTDDGEVVEFDVSSRLNAVLEVVEEASHKVLVFVPFTHAIQTLKIFLDKHKIPSEVINGQVSFNKRNEIIKRFQEKDDTDIKVLIIQPQAASHGLTLTAANIVVWYSPVTSVETYLQANARINRPGQRNAMTVVHITGSEVETKLFTMLKNNIVNHNKIVELYRQELDLEHA